MTRYEKIKFFNELNNVSNTILAQNPILEAIYMKSKKRFY